MINASINWWAVIAAMVAQMAVGFIWFSPGLFFKKWLDANRLEAPGAPRPWIFIVLIVLTFISTTALDMIVQAIGASTAGNGMLIAFIIWLATLMPFIVGTTFATGRKYSLIALEYGHTIIGFLAAGAILGAWR